MNHIESNNTSLEQRHGRNGSNRSNLPKKGPASEIVIIDPKEGQIITIDGTSGHTNTDQVSIIKPNL